MNDLPVYRWQPTTAEIAAAAGIPPEAVERFDHNTSPFDAAWTSDVLTRSAAGLNEYPGASYRPLRDAVGRARGTDPERVAVGAGADELILLAARAWLRPGTAAVAAVPTYSLYAIATAQSGATFVPVTSEGPDFRFPVDGVIDAARDAEVTWLCIPGNPTSARPTDDEVAAIIAATDGLVVLDAAYAEFADHDWTDTAETHHNLLVLHTLSKAYGLGGIRVGYALGHPDLVARIDAVRPPGSLASPSVAVAVAALAEPDRMRATVESLVAERGVFGARLRGLGFRVLPSDTNFLLCEVGAHARTLAADLMGEGLVVRTFPEGGPLADYLRFTVRTPDAHDRLIDAIERSS